MSDYNMLKQTIEHGDCKRVLLSGLGSLFGGLLPARKAQAAGAPLRASRLRRLQKIP